MNRKKILIFSLAYEPVVGGAEVAVKEITNHLTDIDFDLITLRFSEDHKEKEKIGNCNVYRLNTSKNLFPFKAYLFATKLHKEKSYDATWAVMANWAGFAALFFKLSFPNVPYLLNLQEGDSFSYIKSRVWFVYPLFRRIFLRADVIQPLSNYLADWARSMGYKGRIEIIPNGVDFQRFENFNQKEFDSNNVVIITTSRLVEKNAVGDIIESLKFLPQNVSLKILGTGPLEKSLQLKAKSLQLDKRVEFLNHIPNEDLPKYLHKADIFVRPSLSEGFGISFIEAMAAGLPVIATPVGGIVDFLEDEETGLFCKVKNPESIAKAVERLISDKTLRSKIITNAKKMVKERYDWDLVAKEMKERVFNLF